MPDYVKTPEGTVIKLPTLTLSKSSKRKSASTETTPKKQKSTPVDSFVVEMPNLDLDAYYQVPVKVSQSLDNFMGNTNANMTYPKDAVYKAFWEYVHQNKKVDDDHTIYLDEKLKEALSAQRTNSLTIDDLNLLILRQLEDVRKDRNELSTFKIIE